MIYCEDPDLLVMDEVIVYTCKLADSIWDYFPLDLSWHNASKLIQNAYTEIGNLGGSTG